MVLLKKNIVSVVKSTVKFKKTAGNIIALLLLVKILGISAIELPKIVRAGDNNTKIESVLIFKPDSYKALFLQDNKPEIVPGESMTQKLAREEAELKAKAEAEKNYALRNTISRERRVYLDPSDLSPVYMAAEAMFGVDSRLLESIHYVETGRSGSTSKTSYAGATGPMQFLPSTFRRYAVDGNSDGIKDINNVEDAIFSAANYLKACGYPNIKKALWGYNPSQYYYTKVASVAKSLGMEM